MNLIRMAHDVPIAGHFAKDKTLARLKHWHQATKAEDVEVYCRSCPVCQECNISPEKKAKLMPFPLAKGFNDRVHIDLLWPLPNNNRYKYILIMIDAYSRFIQIAPAQTKEIYLISIHTGYLFLGLAKPQLVIYIFRLLFFNWYFHNLPVFAKPCSSPAAQRCPFAPCRAAKEQN